MNYFITSIVNDSHCQGRNYRTFGYFKELKDALSAVRRNSCNMHECLYTHLIIEAIGEGIHPEVKEEIWFVWDDEDGWKSCDKPDRFKCVVNWAIG